MNKKNTIGNLNHRDTEAQRIEEMKNGKLDHGGTKARSLGGEERELPEGWVLLHLEDVARWGSGGTPSRSNLSFYIGNIPWIKTGELGKGNILNTEEHISKDALNNSSAKIFPAGSVAIAMYGATIGKTAILGISAACNQACAVAVCTQICSNKYLIKFLDGSMQEFKKLGQGGAQPNISQDILRKFIIPIPPILEQERIVERLDKLLGKLKMARTHLEALPDIIKRFRKSVLAQAVSGKLTEEWREEHAILEYGRMLLQRIILEREKRNETIIGKNNIKDDEYGLTSEEVKTRNLNILPKTWIWCIWNNLADWITYGFTKPMPHVATGIPIVTAKNIRDGYIDFVNLDFTTREAFDSLSEKDKPKVGEILITKDGAIRGRAAIVEVQKTICISQSVAVIRFGGLTANLKYLLTAVRLIFEPLETELTRY